MKLLRIPTILSLLLWLVFAGILINVLLAQPYLKPVSFQLENDPVVLFSNQPKVNFANDTPNNSSVLKVIPRLLIDEPHSVLTFSKYDEIINYNKRLYKIIQKAPLYLITDSSSDRIELIKRPISSLPFGFWMACLTSLIGLLAGVGIWSFQPDSLATRLLLACGVLFSSGVMFTNFYTHRILAMEPIWFDASLSMQYLTLGWFPFALLALLLTYPQQVVNKSWVYITFILPFVFYANYIYRWTELPFHTFFINSFIALVLGTMAAVAQWRAVRDKPLDRARLRWFLISIYTAPLIAVVFYQIPSFIGLNPVMPLWVAQMMLLSIFLGFVLGVVRYRLFDVERWWFKIWLWFVSGVLLVILDFLLISIVQIESTQALALAVIILAWLYFPLRQLLWSKLAKSQSSDPIDYLPLMLDQVFEQEHSSKNLKQAWNNILQTVFEPTEIISVNSNVKAINITEYGLYLDVPDIEKASGVRLAGRSKGTQLFSLHDQNLAHTLMTLIQKIIRAKHAHQRGARIERQRIIRDLHDDVGANLLTMSYRADSESQANLARDTLKLMRETIYALDDEAEVYLNNSIAEWRTEIHDRCKSAGINVDWQCGHDLPDVLLKPRQRINLNRVIREAINNVLKHGNGESISVIISKSKTDLVIDLCNQSNLTNSKEWLQRTGTHNIRRRIKELEGQVSWISSSFNEVSSMVYLSMRVPLFV